MINSRIQTVGTISLPAINTEHAMLPFDLATLEGVALEHLEIVKQMISSLKVRVGTAFFTLHGKMLKKSETLRRPIPHTDGNYTAFVRGVPYNKSHTGGNGHSHRVGHGGGRHTGYTNEKGGIIIASTFAACKAYEGVFDGEPAEGGDCSHIKLNDGFMLGAGKMYYGNNRMIHESLPMTQDVHRTFARISLPETHEYEVN